MENQHESDYNGLLDKMRDEDAPAFLIAQYQSLSAKENSHMMLVWSAPSLLFVGQTILWSVALDNGISPFIRCVVSIFSIFVGFASLQNFIRTRLIQIAESMQLESIEKLMKKRYGCMITFQKLEKREIIQEGRISNIMIVLGEHPFYKKHRLSKIHTFTIWEGVFYSSLIIASIILIYNLLSLFHINICF